MCLALTLSICLQPQRGLELYHQLFAEPVLPYWWVNSVVLVTNVQLETE